MPHVLGLEEVGSAHSDRQCEEGEETEAQEDPDVDEAGLLLGSKQGGGGPS